MRFFRAESLFAAAGLPVRCRLSMTILVVRSSLLGIAGRLYREGIYQIRMPRKFKIVFSASFLLENFSQSTTLLNRVEGPDHIIVDPFLKIGPDICPISRFLSLLYALLKFLLKVLFICFVIFTEIRFRSGLPLNPEK